MDTTTLINCNKCYRDFLRPHSEGRIPGQCPDCRSLERGYISVRWAKKNPERRKEIARNWVKKFPEKKKEIDRRFLKSDSPKARRHRLASLVRCRIVDALKNGYSGSRSLKLLGMEIDEYRIYLQGQFRDGMTWENRGKVWHIDHIRPCASFDLNNLGHRKDCFNWSNTQPLLVKENLEKSDKYGV